MVIRSTRSATVSPATMLQVRIAPALTIGFGGRPVPSSSRMASNASPVGSTPTAPRTASGPLSAMASAYTNGLTADCSENGLVASPALYT